MATAEKIIDVIGELDFDKSEFAIFGGACLALRGIREARDIELFITESVKRTLIDQGWTERTFDGRNPHIVGQVGCVDVELFSSWDGDGWQPAIDTYLEKPEIVRGLPCMPLDELLIWKRLTARPKDLRDIELVELWRR